MYSPITLDALRVLDAIERQQSFAAAANELFRVPSAISYTVTKLEEELGVKLFNRSRRKAVLTPVGRLVLEQGRKILIATEELTAQAREAADGWEIELKIGIDSVLNHQPIYELVREFQLIRPRIKIELFEEVLGGTWDALSSGRCDLVIGAEGQPPHQGFSTWALGKIVFEFAVAPNHPLITHELPIPFSAILNYPTVVVADSSRYMPVRSLGLLDGRSRIVVPSVERKIEAQKNGLGVGYLPLHRIQREIKSGALHILQLEEPRLPLLTSAAWRSDGKGKALQWFIKRVQAMSFNANKGLILEVFK